MSPFVHMFVIAWFKDTTIRPGKRQTTESVTSIRDLTLDEVSICLPHIGFKQINQI